MLRRTLCAAVVVAVAVGAAAAAEAIKVELKDFKFKDAEGNDTTSELYGFNEGEGKLFLYTNGAAVATVKVPEDGEYTITLELSCDEAKGEKAKVKLKVGDNVVKDSFELKSTEAKEYPFTAKLKKGEQKLSIEFLNDEFKEGEYDRNLFIHAVKLEKKK